MQALNARRGGRGEHDMEERVGRDNLLRYGRMRGTTSSCGLRDMDAEREASIHGGGVRAYRPLPAGRTAAGSSIASARRSCRQHRRRLRDRGPNE